MSLRLPDSMLWRIYQAYLQRPSALLRLFEDAFGLTPSTHLWSLTSSSAPSMPSLSRSSSSRGRSGGYRLKSATFVGATLNSSAGTRSWRCSWRRTLITPAARLP